MSIEAVSLVTAGAFAAIALYFVVSLNRQERALNRQTLVDKDKQIAELKQELKELRSVKDELIKQQAQEIAELRRRIDNKDDKAETMLGEIGDLKGDLNFERGIYARPEADALQEQKIERIKNEPNPLDDSPKSKRGKK